MVLHQQGQLRAADRQIIELEPDFMGGFNTRVGYKGLDLSIIGTFQKGGILNSTLYGSGGYLNNLNTRSGNNVKIDYWTTENTDRMSSKTERSRRRQSKIWQYPGLFRCIVPEDTHHNTWL